MNGNFELIEGEEADKIREAASTTGKRPYSPVTRALLEGQTVFLVGRTTYSTKTFQAMGKRLRSTRGERGGKSGVYVWLEDAGPS